MFLFLSVCPSVSLLGGGLNFLSAFFVIKNYSLLLLLLFIIGWWRGVVVNALVMISEVTLRWAQLVLGCVTVCGRINYLGM